MSFVWFWTFWHWSTEGVRAGALLRGPVQGIASHWDEWYRHELSDADREAIAEAGRSVRTQRRFVSWLVRCWATEATWRGEHPPVRFVLGQLAWLAPFDRWPAFARYRDEYGTGGIAAIVLTEESAGEASDVRLVEAITVPGLDDAGAQAVVAEGFQADAAELHAARAATLELLRGRGLARLLVRWLAGGRRPYPRPLALLLAAGWLVVASLVLRLALGPEPGELLVPLSAALAALWLALVLVALGMAGTVMLQAWRLGRTWGGRLERGQLRLRMEGGLTLVGGSAGLSFCLSALLAVQDAVPRLARRAWLWRRLSGRIRAERSRWAATGVVHGDGRLGAVILEPKLRACLQHPQVTHVLTPRQRDASAHVIRRLAGALPNARRAPARATPPGAGPVLGFASERPALRHHRCRDLADAVLTVGGLTSRAQLAANVLAVAASLAMLAALPDLRRILLPPPAPLVVAPFSPSPYELWVSLDTRHVNDFVVVLDSDFWSNRRSRLVRHDRAGEPPRAELLLSRNAHQRTHDIEDGIVWVERRRTFLGREFVDAERVGRYTLSYLARLRAP